jgi:ankyrin repeat protein
MPFVSPPVWPVLDGFQTRRQYLSFALIEAINVGNSEISEYLISEGADVNFLEDIHPAPPLYHASGNLGLVQLLLASGAQPNLHAETAIPLFNAVGIDNMDIVRALLAGGADIHVRDRALRNVLTQCRSVDLLRFFLERGVDPNAEDRRGQSMLHHACKNLDAKFAKASVELVLQFGATTVNKVDLRQLTPVDHAMSQSHPEVVKILEPLVRNPDLRAKIAMWWEERSR